ncbi:MAG: DUF308 domain-containing protein [Clostridia bacterium]|nr:DUF308 domain-containing protein [Clostridia bacterium]
MANENFNKVEDNEIVKVDFTEKSEKKKRDNLMARIAYICISFLAGIVFIVARNNIFDLLGYIGGGMLLILGVVTVIAFFASKGKAWLPSLIFGIVEAIIGIFFLCKPKIIADFAVYVFAIIIFISGVVMIYFAACDKRNGIKQWIAILIMGIVLSIAGVVMLLFVRQSQAVIAIIAGVSFIVSAVFNVVALALK